MPHRFLRRIRELCTQHGIVMIADEVQTFARTGTLFAIEHSGVKPDLVTIAKALGAGMPISATTGRAEIMDAPHLGGVGGTYGGSPLACAAAIETIGIFRSPAFRAHAAKVSDLMRAELSRMQQNSALIGDVRGEGAMLLIELVLDRVARTPAPQHALAVIKRAVANGVVLIRAGLYSNCVRFMPPLSITEDQVRARRGRRSHQACRGARAVGSNNSSAASGSAQCAASAGTHRSGDKEVVANVPFGDATDANTAIDAAHAAFPTWRARTPYDRGAILMRAASIMRERAEQLADVTVRECGKPRIEAVREWQIGGEIFEFFAEEGKRISGHTVSSRVATKRQLVVHEPLGVVGVITAWNFPVYNPARAIAAALAAGCTVVVRPAELTPLSAMAMVEILDEAGVPAGAINLVNGDPEAMGQAMLDHPDLRKISFTGSVGVGKILMNGAARTMTRLSLELGGNAPVIVMPDADIEVVASAVASKFERRAGLRLAARFLVDAAVKQFEEVSSGDAQTAGGWASIREPRQPADHSSPSRSGRALIATATSAGASIRIGGKRLARKGFFLEPTVLGAGATLPMFAEEVFGPLFVMTPFQKLDEAIAAANSTRYGLAAYVFTNDLNTAMRAYEQLEFGMIGVNEWNPQSIEAPFAGRKESGIGHECGREGLYDNLETKLVSFGNVK
jgi:succinate-semialdehyde dehydrogenase/glutarate-semialdehyde dehydrogenase